MKKSLHHLSLVIGVIFCLHRQRICHITQDAVALVCSVLGVV